MSEELNFITSENGFINAQQMHDAYPETFEAPTSLELQTLRVRDFVKVCKVPERFWAEVMTINGENITAAVTQTDIQLTDIHGIEHGDVITFKKENVYSIFGYNPDDYPEEV